MKITKVNNSDLTFISNLQKQYFLDDWFYSKEELTKFIDNKDVIFIKVIEDKEIIGYLIAYCLTDHIDLYQIIITKSERRKSYGKQLFNCLKKYQLPIFCEVEINNKKAINFYLSLGFNKIKTIKNYFKNCDAILMKRDSNYEKE